MQIRRINSFSLPVSGRRNDMSHHKIIIDDGFNPEFVETAHFDGILEMPAINRPDRLIVPKGMIPFSKHSRSISNNEFLVFYEYDTNFADILRSPDEFEDVLSQFPGIVTLDNSLYVDSPLTVQIANTYRSRAIGHYYQSRGYYVIPNVRWGDERSYTTRKLPEKFAFLGLPKNSIVSIGTYGCCKSAEEQYQLRQGLIAMLSELEPEIVLVYGAMPDKVFKDLKDRTRFINYPDWTSVVRGGRQRGNK